MAKTMENYELMYIIDVDKTDEEKADIVAKFKALIEGSGTIKESDEWGVRKLAYPINDKADGYYVLVKFSATPELPAELDRVLKITDGVVRSLITLAAE